jgi:hypothetical protein
MANPKEQKMTFGQLRFHGFTLRIRQFPVILQVAHSNEG